MSRINNLIKWVVFQINITTSLSGWFTIAMAFYFLFANWGDLDPSFFTGIGVTFLLIGILILSISWIACTGIRNQGKFFGVVTGRKMLITYQIILCIGIIGLFSMASLALNYISDLNKASKFIKLNGISASATQFELTVAAKFNLFFFGASSICDSTAYQWFWDIVNQNCPPNYLSQVLCQKCADYSITGCFADELICNDSGGMFGEACPYSLCRAGIINFFLKHLKYVLLSTNNKH